MAVIDTRLLDCDGEPDPPTKADNTFSGWYLGDVAYAFDSPVTAPITLVAHWTPVATG